MARYLSIEEVAAALGTTDRTVRRMLNDGRLPGSQSKEKGKMVWRVHATKDLLEKLEQLYGESTVSVDSFDVQDEQESGSYEEPAQESSGRQSTPPESSSWHTEELEKLKFVAEELAKALIKPMSEKLDNQTRMIVEQEKEIENLQRQVRLLPDLQRQTITAEEQLKIKHAEAEALAKQVEALKLQLDNESKKASEADQFKEQVTNLSEQVKSLQRPWWKKILGTGE